MTTSPGLEERGPFDSLDQLSAQLSTILGENVRLALAIVGAYRALAVEHDALRARSLLRHALEDTDVDSD